jgi:glycerol kinase
VAFSRSTGKPLNNALVWFDQRTAGIVKQIKDKNGGDVDVYRQDCGLPVNTYFSALKMKWLLE